MLVLSVPAQRPVLRRHRVQLVQASQVIGNNALELVKQLLRTVLIVDSTRLSQRVVSRRLRISTARKRTSSSRPVRPTALLVQELSVRTTNAIAAKPVTQLLDTRTIDRLKNLRQARVDSRLDLPIPSVNTPAMPAPSGQRLIHLVRVNLIRDIINLLGRSLTRPQLVQRATRSVRHLRLVKASNLRATEHDAGAQQVAGNLLVTHSACDRSHVRHHDLLGVHLKDVPEPLLHLHVIQPVTNVPVVINKREVTLTVKQLRRLLRTPPALSALQNFVHVPDHAREIFPSFPQRLHHPAKVTIPNVHTTLKHHLVNRLHVDRSMVSLNLRRRRVLAKHVGQSLVRDKFPVIPQTTRHTLVQRIIVKQVVKVLALLLRSSTALLDVACSLLVHRTNLVNKLRQFVVCLRKRTLRILHVQPTDSSRLRDPLAPHLTRRVVQRTVVRSCKPLVRQPDAARRVRSKATEPRQRVAQVVPCAVRQRRQPLRPRKTEQNLRVPTAQRRKRHAHTDATLNVHRQRTVSLHPGITELRLQIPLQTPRRTTPIRDSHVRRNHVTGNVTRHLRIGAQNVDNLIHRQRRKVVRNLKATGLHRLANLSRNLPRRRPKLLRRRPDNVQNVISVSGVDQLHDIRTVLRARSTPHPLRTGDTTENRTAHRHVRDRVKSSVKNEPGGRLSDTLPRPGSLTVIRQRAKVRRLEPLLTLDALNKPFER